MPVTKLPKKFATNLEYPVDISARNTGRFGAAYRLLQVWPASSDIRTVEK